MKMPLLLDVHDVQRETVAPSVVVAIGEFGRQVLATLSPVAALRHGFANTHAVWVGPSGWAIEEVDRLAPWAEPDTAAWIPADQWWECHDRSGLRVLQQAVERAQKGAATDEQTLDLYLVGHLQEEAVQALWQQVLAAERAAAIPFSDHVFTLIFATDSRTFGQLPAGEAEALHASLTALAVELEAATDHREQPGRTGWCYLVDTVNANGYPLRPVAYLESAPEVLQAHIIVEFIAHLAGGLRQTESYRRLNLAGLQRDSREAEPEARVGSFAAGSLLFPVLALSEHARDQLARRLLADHLVGADQPGDLPTARLLRERWLAAHSLVPADLRRDISHDAGGHPIEFSLEPPRLHLIYDDDPERLPDALRNWDQILWQRWVHDEGPLRQMGGSAARKLSKVTGWLDETLETLLHREVGGLRRVGHFVREAEIAVLMERERNEDTSDRGWLALLLSAVHRRPDPTVIPDLEAVQRRLERALDRRVNRRAVWARASVLAVVLLSFVWIAYLGSGKALGLQGLAVRYLGVEAAGLATSLDLLVAAVLCWLVMLLTAWVTIYRSEKAVIRAAERIVDDTRQKYRALMERTVRQERERVYSGALAALAGWRERVELHKQIIAAAVEKLDEGLAYGPQTNMLLTERLLLPPELWVGQLPEPDPGAEAEMAVEFLAGADSQAWRTEGGEELLAAVRAFAVHQLRLWRSQLVRTPWMPSPSTPEPVSSFVSELRQTLRPAWPLDREERMAATAGNTLAATNGQKQGGARMVTFVGLPPSSEMDISIEGNNRGVFFRSGESGRLAYASTVHNLPLRDLRLWQTLADVYHLDGGDRDSVEIPTSRVTEPAS